MSRNLLLHMAVGACVLMPAAFVQAEEKGDLATLRLSHGAWRYDQNTSKDDNGTTETKTETSGFTTFPSDAELAAFIGDYSLYIYPEASGSSVSFGKAFDNQEAGLIVGINSRNVKDGNERSTNALGAYYFYTRPLTSTIDFEFDVSATYAMGSEKSVTSATPPVTTKRDMTGLKLYLDLLGVVPLAKNVEYVFGLDYTQSSEEYKIKGANKQKQSESNLGLILAKFRYTI